MWLNLLINNWKYIFVCLVTLGLTAKVLSWYYNGRIESEVTAARAQEQEACAKAAQITEEANASLAKNYDITRRKLADAKRMSKAKCVLPANPSVPPASGRGYAGQNGISTDWLREYGAECRDYQTQRIVLEKFIKDVQELNGK